MEEKGHQVMMEAVRRINILEGTGMGRKLDAREAELHAMRGEKVADDIRNDPRFSRVGADPEHGVEASNPGGSFEALMSGWLSSSHGQALDTSTAAQEETA